jgi:uncharacterized membrane protein (UPF0127 family)
LREREVEPDNDLREYYRLPIYCGMRMKRRLINSIMALLMLMVTGLVSCTSEAEKLEEQVELRVGSETFTVEVARTPEQRRKGLMHRSSIGENEGMLFVFERDRHLSFWMKNTEIPLSIAYISSDGEIREIRELEPHSERSVESSYAVRYALELPRGAFERAGAEVGDRLELPVSE